MAAKQVNSASGFGTALNCAYLSNVVGGNLLICGGHGHSTDSSTVISTDTAQLAIERDDTTNSLFSAIHYVENGGSGARTWTRNQVADDQAIVIAEYEGFPASAGRLDVTASNLGFSTSASSSATTITAQLDELLIGVTTFESAGSPATATGGMTEDTEVGSARPAMLASRQVAVQATYTNTATLAPTPNWVCMIAAFKMTPIPKPDYSFRRKQMRPAMFSPGNSR